MLAELKPYSDYVASNIPGVNAVPAHWRTVRIKTVLRELDRRSRDGSGTLLSLTRIRGLIRQSEMTSKATTAATLEGYKVYHPGEIVMNRMQAWSGMFGTGPEAGLVSPDYAVFRVRDGNDPAFLVHLLRSPAMVAQFAVESKGIGSGFNRLYTDKFGAIAMPLPPPSEQAGIVRFLGAVDRKVNRLIKAKRRLIEVLTEQKQAIITHAVTKGLNPRAPLKPSGIDWLGDVPDHWEVLPLRRRCTVIDCKHVTVEFVEDGIPLASVREVQTFDLSLRKAKRTTPDWYEKLIEGDRRPRRGDIIYCRNVSVGAAAIVNTDEPCAMGQDVCLIRSKDNPRYINYFLHSALMDRQLSMVLVGSTFDRINVAEVKALTVIFPPKREQDVIASHLDGEMQSFEVAIAAINREIDLIREYRTRLVADVVTGKIDVRAAAAEVTEEVDDKVDAANDDEDGDTDSDIEDASDQPVEEVGA